MLFDGNEALHRADTVKHVFKKETDGVLRAHVFDIMQHEDKNILDEPLRERINILFYQYSEHSDEALAFPSKKDTRIAAFGSTTIKAVKNNGLILDVEVPNKKFPSMSMALDDYITKANKRKRPKK